MIFLLTVWYPPNKSIELGKKLLKALKMPPFIKKWQVFSATGGVDGLKAYHLIMSERGKGDEALIEITKTLVPFWEIEGYKYNIEVLMGVQDAFKVVGLQ
jgi:hypothetical protein